MKKRIFIGSSKESLLVAEIVKQYYANRKYECVIWNRNFFELNENTFDELIKNLFRLNMLFLLVEKMILAADCSITKRNLHQGIIFILNWGFLQAFCRSTGHI